MMGHLRVRFLNSLPQLLEWVADGGKYRSAFLIPKARRMDVLQFLESQPQHIVNRAKTFVEVLGYLPEGAQVVGAGPPNAHRDFANLLRQALQFMPTHDLEKLSPSDLKKDPSLKALYVEFFKVRPELLNEKSVLSAAKSRLLNFAEDTGQMADVRMEHMLPVVPTTATSLQNKKKGDLIACGCWC